MQIPQGSSARYTPDQNPAENIVKILTQGVATLMHQFGGPTLTTHSEP